ncbi:MAG: tRNA pseudouridine(38-40) synthase TruA [Tidjanibacter sp.]|nr:tRNA pseudouridine(38-40) synthase TruA [Tidjanibacter sp.]MBR3853343.1 tRNA pseudouridine(38-40) synthase TruA [Tidjanibacter sp.]
MRYFAELSYKGTAYCGWQRQPNAPSVQQTIEEALSTILRENVEVVGAGRTDTGVHAAFYVAHFDTSKPIAQPEDFVYHLNALLPEDVAFGRIYAVAESAHARFDATEREYRYYIEPRKNPFTRATSWQLSAPLDVEAMNRAAAVLLTTEDFTTFAKLGSNNTNNICHIFRAEWIEIECGMLVFVFRANRFLRNMVRAVVGTLVDVGRGKISPEEFAAIVASRDLSRSSSSAPAAGLFLTDVRYK